MKASNRRQKGAGEIERVLRDRLVGKGMDINTIPAYVRDLGRTISVTPPPTLQDLNRQLQLLGWDDFELDDHTLQLIIANFDDVSHLQEIGDAR